MTGTKLTQNGPIVYHALLATVIGSITSTILLRQIVYWHGKMGKHFFKYRKPCDESKPGDSWCEELGFSPSEFDGALKRIGTKLAKGKNGEPAPTIEDVFEVETLPDAEPGETILAYLKRIQKSGVLKHLVAYWTTQDRQTYYAFNEPLYDLCFAVAYPNSEIANWEMLNYLIHNSRTGKDTETTTETTKIPAASSDDAKTDSDRDGNQEDEPVGELLPDCAEDTIFEYPDDMDDVASSQQSDTQRHVMRHANGSQFEVVSKPRLNAQEELVLEKLAYNQRDKIADLHVDSLHWIPIDNGLNNTGCLRQCDTAPNMAKRYALSELGERFAQHLDAKTIERAHERLAERKAGKDKRKNGKPHFDVTLKHPDRAAEYLHLCGLFSLEPHEKNTNALKIARGYSQKQGVDDIDLVYDFCASQEWGQDKTTHQPAVTLDSMNIDPDGGKPDRLTLARKAGARKTSTASISIAIDSEDE